MTTPSDEFPSPLVPPARSGGRPRTEIVVVRAPECTPPDDTTEPTTTEDRYWQAEAQRARAERDALALRLLQMADAWEERFTDTGVRVAVVAEAVRTTVDNAGGH